MFCDIFLNLELANSGELFRSDKNLAGYGLIPHPADPKYNPDGKDALGECLEANATALDHYWSVLSVAPGAHTFFAPPCIIAAQQERGAKKALCNFSFLIIAG